MPADAAQNITERKAKGAQPHFFDDPNTDRLLSMVMDLALEVSVLRDRLDTHERVAEAKGAYTSADIEAYEASDDVRDARDKWRNNFIDKLMKRIESEYEPGI
ncbi:MAG: hypothetical protein JNM81_12055 [Rhodospirillaceae bacterium]|nr:hypothetical protein [Rhodospirillaceae bacterium]